MRTLWLALAVAMSLACGSAPGEDFRGDLPVIRDFLDRDRSYDQEERAAAELAFQELSKRAGNVSPAAYQLSVAHLAALAGNGHTALFTGGWAQLFPRLPLELHVFADGLFVIHAPEALAELRGAQALAIDGHDLGALEKAFSRYSGARDTNRRVRMPPFLEAPALLEAAGLAKSEDHVSMKLRLADGRVVTRRVDTTSEAGSSRGSSTSSPLVRRAAENVVGASVPMFLGEPERVFRSVPLPELGALFVQLRANYSVGGEDIAAFGSRVLASVRAEKPRHLILDLRFNGGGDLNTTRDLFVTLPSLLPTDGRIFALTSGGTFSAGIASLGYLKQAGGKRVTIVGEPVGDFLEFYAEGRPMFLPVSGAVLLPATERHNYQTGCPEPDCHGSIRQRPIRVSSLEPDVKAPLTYADYRAGRDAAMANVREALGRPAT